MSVLELVDCTPTEGSQAFAPDELSYNLSIRNFCEGCISDKEETVVFSVPIRLSLQLRQGKLIHSYAFNRQ